MANTRLIALNANNGAFVNIVASQSTRSYEAKEDEAGSTQGLQVQTPLDNFATTNVFSFPSEPLQVPNFLTWPLKGRLFGLNAQGQAGAFNFRAADKLLVARSNGAAGTTLRFIEWE
jgi:hypothetical protein